MKPADDYTAALEKAGFILIRKECWGLTTEHGMQIVASHPEWNSNQWMVQLGNDFQDYSALRRLQSIEVLKNLEVFVAFCNDNPARAVELKRLWLKRSPV